jgi:hypothetical protein
VNEVDNSRGLAPHDDSPIFIVGCSRSGTSLLRDLLRSHPRLSFPPESHFIPRFFRGWGDPATAEEAQALGSRILRLATVRRWELELRPEAFRSCRSFADILEVLYGEFARMDGKRRWGDKTPHHVAEIPELARIFPDAKVIHIYRDGRDVALSWLARYYGPRNLHSAAVAWRDLVSAGRRDGPRLGSAYTEVSYEGLLEHPERTMRAVCDFLREPFTDSVLKPAERTSPYVWRQIQRGTYRHRGEIERGNAGNWRDSMALPDRALFESVAGELTRELGYPVEGLARPLPRARRAWWRVDNAVRSTMDWYRFREFSLTNSIALRRADLRSRLRRGRRFSASR